jgi:hypothetical protein
VKFLVSICLALTVPLCWGQILFDDDFDDGDADGWYEVDTGCSYTVNGDFRYEFAYEEGSDDDFCLAYRGDLGQVMSTRDYSVMVETIAHSPTNRIGIGVRFNPGTYTSYTAYLNHTTGTYYIIRYDSFNDYEVLSPSMSYPGGFDHGTSYWVRFQCHADTFKVKIWEGGPSQEPENWMMTRTDDTYYVYGAAYVEAFSNPADDFNAEFDNVEVTWEVGLEPETWAGIKASFGQ